MKKLMVIAMVMILALALTTPAMAFEVDERENVQVFNAGFHCGTYGGNGRVWISNYVKGEWHEFEYAGDNTWTLLSEDFVCPECGSNEWVSYSNKSGVPNGKNIQLKHPGAPDPEPEPSGIIVNDEVYLTTITETIVQKWQRELTPFKTITQLYSQFESTTLSNAGNPKVVTNSNHFCYAVLSKAELENGPIALELFNGNKLNVVGTASASLVDGQIVVDFDDVLSSTYGIVAFDGFMPVVKNGNIHSVGIFKTGRGNAVTPLTLNSYQSSDKKAADYDKDWAEITKNVPQNNDNIYLYMHANPIKFDKGIVESEIEWIVTKDYELQFDQVVKTSEVTEKVFGVTYAIYDAEGEDVTEDAADLEPGFYTVVFYDPYIDEYVTFENIEVVEGIDTEITYEAEYSEVAAPIIITKYLPDIENELVIVNKSVAVK